MLGNQDLMHFKELGRKAAFLLNQITVGSLTNLKERKEKKKYLLLHQDSQIKVRRARVRRTEFPAHTPDWAQQLIVFIMCVQAVDPQTVLESDPPLELERSAFHEVFYCLLLNHRISFLINPTEGSLVWRPLFSVYFSGWEIQVIKLPNIKVHS